MGLIIASLASQYVDKTNPFPDDGLKRAVKNQPQWYKKVGDAVLSQYFNNQSALPYAWKSTKTRSITELRSYAMGEQDVNQFKPMLCQSLEDDGGKAYMNISWAAVRSIPLFRNVIKGIAIKMAYKINVDALDPSSIADKKAEEAYYMLQVDPDWIAFSKQMESVGVNVPKSEFQTEHQVQVWKKSGGLKLAVEIAMKVALEATLYLSKFEDNVKVQLIDDFIDLALGITKDYVEPGTRYVKTRYVDPEFYIGRFSKFLDHHNQDYGFELRLMTISEIRKESDLDEIALMSIAKKYQKDYGNAGNRFMGGDSGIYNAGFYSRYKDEYGCLPIDDFKVPVLDGGYISADIDFYVKAIRKGSGNLMYGSVGQDYELQKREMKKGKTLEGKRNENWYKFKYIIGSNFVFDYGPDTDIAHDGPDGHKTVVNPFHVYKLGTSSVVDLLIPIENDMCLATYKFRNAVTRIMPPPGVTIETGILNNLSFGGVNMTPKQATSMGLETGFLPIQSLTDHGKVAMAGNSAPINPIQQNIMQYAEMYAFQVDRGFAMAHKITGINDLTAATQPQERTGKGVMEMSVQLSNNVIAPLFKGYEVVFEQSMRSCGLRWQNILRNGDVEGRFKALGQNNIEAFKLTKDISFMDFGLTIEAMPSEAEMEMLLQDLIALKNKNISEGSGGISGDSYVLIYRTIRSGNLDLAFIQINAAIQEQRTFDAQMKQQDIQMNAQVQQQSLQANIKGKQAELEQTAGYKMDEIDRQGEIDKEADIRQHRFNMDEIAAKGQIDLQGKNLVAETTLTKELIGGKKKAQEST